MKRRIGLDNLPPQKQNRFQGQNVSLCKSVFVLSSFLNAQSIFIAIINMYVEIKRIFRKEKYLMQTEENSNGSKREGML